MLTIFVPALVALLVVMIGQAWAATSARQAQERTTWRTLQQDVLLETQDRLMELWVATAKLLRGSAREDLQTTLQEASARITVLGSRIADRQLADDLAKWHHEMALEVTRVRGEGVRTQAQVQEHHQQFLALVDRLGSSAIGLRPKSVR